MRRLETEIILLNDCFIDKKKTSLGKEVYKNLPCIESCSESIHEVYSVPIHLNRLVYATLNSIFITV